MTGLVAEFGRMQQDLLLKKETVQSGTRRITPKTCSSSGELSRSSSIFLLCVFLAHQDYGRNTCLKNRHRGWSSAIIGRLNYKLQISFLIRTLFSLILEQSKQKTLLLNTPHYNTIRSSWPRWPWTWRSKSQCYVYCVYCHCWYCVALLALLLLLWM
jgi:hypothetical protein